MNEPALVLVAHGTGSLRGVRLIAELGEAVSRALPSVYRDVSREVADSRSGNRQCRALSVGASGTSRPRRWTCPNVLPCVPCHDSCNKF